MVQLAALNSKNFGTTDFLDLIFLTGQKQLHFVRLSSDLEGSSRYKPGRNSQQNKLIQNVYKYCLHLLLSHMHVQKQKYTFTIISHPFIFQKALIIYQNI